MGEKVQVMLNRGTSLIKKTTLINGTCVAPSVVNRLVPGVKKLLRNNYFSCAVDQTVAVLLLPIRARRIRLQLISTNHRHQAASCLDQIHFQIIHLLILEFLPRTIRNLIQCLLTSLIHLHISTANKVNFQIWLTPETYARNLCYS